MASKTCSLQTCNKAVMKRCEHNLCRNCGIENKCPCESHSTEAQDIERIKDMLAKGELPKFDKIDDSLVFGKHRGVLNKNYFFESSFERFGDTSIVFYLGSLYRNKRLRKEACSGGRRHLRRIRTSSTGKSKASGLPGVLPKDRFSVILRRARQQVEEHAQRQPTDEQVLRAHAFGEILQRRFGETQTDGNL